ncbi:uncharacterized protein LOC117124628 [Anneissia japonica]|uniref:uncharacterized protein LOC117124628 n=1 Tax=Anneissia japonica TaxID=1529436 RepID=UPI001425732D|nr:uncharacterized protein LOC117124628 [Anneissia japonica]XP_033126815.1 uncharacterized protein LOC117124628 [Anneissia japonica]XP_033126816.1 uncharacterized protein LOC117124628 [Anneissia japonica]
MLHRKTFYGKDEGLFKEKERKKEYFTQYQSIGPSFIKSSQDMDDSEPSVAHELPSKGTMKYESHIEDICKSLRMFSQVIFPHKKVISESDEQIIRLMSEKVNLIIKDSITELKKQSSEDIGKMFAHVLIAVQDEENVLEEIHKLCTNDIVSSLSTECKKLNFKYDITRYYECSFKSINISFLIHLLCNAPALQLLDLICCDIKGVNVNDIADTLYQEGVVLELTDLDISGNNLNEIKGSSLATLLAVAPKLNDLDMSKCSIPGAVMDDMVKECSSRGVVLELTRLYISENNLNDIKGSSLATLLAVAPKLNELDMSKCSIPGAVMDDMVKECSSRGVVLKLTYLNISENNLNEIKGSSLATLLAVAPKLNVLGMRNCRIPGAVMDDMVKECCSRGVVLQLTWLVISENNLNDIKGSSLATLLAVAPKLNVLGMRNCRIPGAVIDDMVKECCSRGVVLQLTQLDISGNNLNDIKGSSLATLLAVAPKLNDLDMRNCSIPGAVMDDMVKECFSRGVVLQLTQLDISGNNLNDIKGSSLATLLAVAPNLNDLDMRNCSIPGAVMDDMVKECSSRGVVLQLTPLDISGNNLNDIKGSSLATLLAVAPKLNDLYMRNCHIPGAVMDDMVKECSSRGVVLQLTWLVISENNLNDIKGSSLATLLAVAPKLNDLYMRNCRIPGAVMDDMVKECCSRGVVLQLTQLDISGNNLNEIKGSSLATLLAVAPKLNDLDMRNCSIPGAVMDDMVKECSSRGVVLQLTWFDISENNLNDIKGSSLATLLAVAPKLSVLYMRNCRIPGALMDDMVKECSSRGVKLRI